MIYLVGAAWLPLGMHAVDRWVRLGRRWGLWELAIVLAMQVLGGDPQAAYLLGLAGVGYALGLAWSQVACAQGRRDGTEGDETQVQAGPDRGLAALFGLDRGRLCSGRLRRSRWASCCRSFARSPMPAADSSAALDAVDAHWVSPWPGAMAGAGFRLLLLLAPPRLATPAGGHVAGFGDGGRVWRRA